jgi:hypothetical protein
LWQKLENKSNKDIIDFIEIAYSTRAAGADV